MNERVARQLRKIAHHRWSELKPAYQQFVTVKKIGKDVKREYYKGKRDGI